jgi:hypothetical protein
MRASNARQVTATTCPLVDIQLSFCSRSASAYFGGNLPQKAKLVNGLGLNLPSRDGRLAAKTRLPGAAPRRAFFRAWLAIRRPTRPPYWTTLSLFLGRFDVPPMALLVCPSAMTAVAVPAVATQQNRHHAQERTGYKRPFRLDICDRTHRATMATNARGVPTRAYLADRFRVRRKRDAARERFGRARIRLRDAIQARR